MNTAPDLPGADDARRLALDVLGMTQDALISVVDFMIADWGKPDEPAKKQAVDALLTKLKRFSDVRQELLTRVADDRNDDSGA